MLLNQLGKVSLWLHRCVLDRAVCIADGLMRQKNALIAEIRSLKEDHEVSINALNVTHQLTVESLNERLDMKLASQLAAGQPRRTVVPMKIDNRSISVTSVYLLPAVKFNE